MDRRLEVFAYELGLHTKAEIDTLAGGKFCFVTITADLLARGLAKRFPGRSRCASDQSRGAVRPERGVANHVEHRTAAWDAARTGANQPQLTWGNMAKRFCCLPFTRVKSPPT